MEFVCVDDFENYAYDAIEKNALDYYRSGAGDQFTLELNRKAFKRFRLRPRFLRDVSHIDTSCNILSTKLKWPLGIAPTAMQKMAHTDGEVATACAGGATGSVFILSTLATSSIEEVAQAAPDTCKWFQLYVYKDRSLSEKLIRRAENAGFKAIVLTIDAPIFGERRSDIRNKFRLPENLRLANFEGNLSDNVKSSDGRSGINEYVVKQFDATLTWNDIKWLRKITKLPIIVKGVLTQEDAILAKKYKCAGVIVSNHGARQLDSVPATIEVLPDIVKAVGKDLVVMIDGGIRTGNDIFKALGLGAKMVFIGRPAIWGLAYGGQYGVEKLLNILKREFETTLALSGCSNILDIKPEMIVHEKYYGKL